ncbi:MAG: hypothetical protein QOH35_465 [Acidobacteriaceae bacterium]|jgi:hypothetical protein|nr:hypothetical protein [Acidobacteriaceae bacterium]MDX6462147.1 hypothetical protein [Acidobacteriaceae bacterium]MEA2539099.1 hypothetical protein [Acidobacteriaceae bacterium]
MRRVILGAGISLDGYIARRNGGIDFLHEPKGYSMSAFVDILDTMARVSCFPPQRPGRSRESARR